MAILTCLHLCFLPLQMVEGMRSGSIPRHEGLLRQVNSLVASLPALDSERFNHEYLTVSHPVAGVESQEGRHGRCARMSCMSCRG